MKECRVCKLEKTLDSFSINKTKKAGINDECKECQKEYFKKYYDKNKEKHIHTVLSYTIERKIFLAQKKMEYGCIKCGYKDHPSALQFHHKDPKTKSFTIGSGNNKTFQELKDEIKKCVVLCANCHFIEHVKNDDNIILEARKRINKKKKVDHQNLDEEQKQIKYGKCPPKEVLEKLVWEIPSEKIGEKYGVSGRAVGKWCKKYEIDKPPRGYWAKRSRD